MRVLDFSKKLYRETVLNLRKNTPAPIVLDAIKNVHDWFSDEETLAQFSDAELSDFLLNRIQYRMNSIQLIAEILVIPRINCVYQLILAGEKATEVLSKIGESKLSYLIRAMEELGDVHIVPMLKVFADVNRSVKAKEIIYYKFGEGDRYLPHMRQQTTYMPAPIYPQYPAVQFVPYNPFPVVQFRQSQQPNYNAPRSSTLPTSRNHVVPIKNEKVFVPVSRIRESSTAPKSDAPEAIPTAKHVDEVLQFLDSGLDDSKMGELSSSFISPTFFTPQVLDIDLNCPEIWDLECENSSSINRS